MAASVLTSPAKVFAIDNSLLSSSKLCTEACLIQKKKPFKNALNRIGPATEP